MEQMGHSAQHGGRMVSVETPDVPQLPWRMADGAKEFHLIAESVDETGINARQGSQTCGGYNGSAPGPHHSGEPGVTVSGSSWTNHLPESHVDATGMDLRSQSTWMERRGVAKIRFRPAVVSFTSFTLHQAGTFLLPLAHGDAGNDGDDRDVHHAPQESLRSPRLTETFAIILQEYAILPNNPIPNSMNMEFNWLTFQRQRLGPAHYAP